MRNLRAMTSIVILLGILLAACVPAATPAPGAKPASTKPAVVQGPTAVPATTSAPESTGQLSSETQAIIAGAQKVQAGEPTGVLPPQQQVDALNGIFKDLCAKGMLVKTTCCDRTQTTCAPVFNEKRATTYTLPSSAQTASPPLPQGALIQMVSLAQPVDDLLNKLPDWQGSALAIGGLLVYPKEGAFGVPPSNYVVLLRADTKNYTVELVKEDLKPILFGTWQLRELKAGLPEPLSYLTTWQLCFAQRTYQACLNQIAPGIGTEGPNRALIVKAVDALIGQGLLSKDSFVNAEGALAEVAGTAAIKDCDAALATFFNKDGRFDTDAPARCLPSIVVAAAELSEEDQANLKELGLASSDSATSKDFSERIIGAAVLAALADVTDVAVDSSGAPVSLPKGNYRVDLLRIRDQNVWLAQFVGASSRFYRMAVPVTLAGDVVNGEDRVGGNDVVLGCIIIRPCRPDGWESPCHSLFCTTDDCKRKPICIL